jgi:hypothetical protein
MYILPWSLLQIFHSRHKKLLKHIPQHYSAVVIKIKVKWTEDYMATIVLDTQVCYSCKVPRKPHPLRGLYNPVDKVAHQYQATCRLCTSTHHIMISLAINNRMCIRHVFHYGIKTNYSALECSGGKCPRSSNRE